MAQSTQLTALAMSTKNSYPVRVAGVPPVPWAQGVRNGFAHIRRAHAVGSKRLRALLSIE